MSSENYTERSILDLIDERAFKKDGSIRTMHEIIDVDLRPRGLSFADFKAVLTNAYGQNGAKELLDPKNAPGLYGFYLVFVNSIDKQRNQKKPTGDLHKDLTSTNNTKQTVKHSKQQVTEHTDKRGKKRNRLFQSQQIKSAIPSTPIKQLSLSADNHGLNSSLKITGPNKKQKLFAK